MLVLCVHSVAWLFQRAACGGGGQSGEGPAATAGTGGAAGEA